MKTAKWFATALAACVWSMAIVAWGGESAFDAEAFIQRALEVTPSTPRGEMVSMSKTVGENGKAVAEAAARRLADKSAKEEDKVKYVWLLGLAKQDSSVPLMLDIFKTSNPTSALHAVTSRVLVEIGGDEVGASFLENYRKNKAKMNESQRFDAMQELAMLKYAPAVKDAEEFLKIDPERYYWQVYFIFGLFDDLAVPMLCEKLNDSDALVRTNALGAIRFLMPESKDMTKALLKRMKVEKDPDIRYQLVETIEWNMLAQGKKGQQELRETFRKLLESEDKNSRAAKFMRETLASKSATPEDMREKSKPDSAKFDAAYKKILENGVHLGSDREAEHDILYCATSKDVPKLKELRRRALYRQSDECFYDYSKLTRFIVRVLAWAPEVAAPETAAKEAADAKDKASDVYVLTLEPCTNSVGVSFMGFDFDSEVEWEAEPHVIMDSEDACFLCRKHNLRKPYHGFESVEVRGDKFSRHPYALVFDRHVVGKFDLKTAQRWTDELARDFIGDCGIKLEIESKTPDWVMLRGESDTLRVWACAGAYSLVRSNGSDKFDREEGIQYQLDIRRIHR